MLGSLKISHKVYLLGIVQLILIFGLGVFTLNNMSKIGQELVHIAEDDVPLVRELTKLTEYQLQQSILFERTLWVSSLAKQSGDSGELKLAQSELKKASEATKEALQTVHTTLDSILGKRTSDAQKSALLAINNRLSDVESMLTRFNQQKTTVMSNFTSLDAAFDMNSVEDVMDTGTKLNAAMMLTLGDAQILTQNATLEAEAHEKDAIVWSSVILFVSLVIGAILPFIISKAITAPINNLSARLEQIADGDGDLSVALDESAKDETGNVAIAFNQFTRVLRDIIRKTNQDAESLGRSSEIAIKAMHETQENSNQQRHETEMVVVAVNEMTTTTQEMMNSASQAASYTNEVRDKVSDGHEVARENKDIIEQLSDEIQKASTDIKNLVSETNNIGQVLQSIQGIAEQTNLLALNAAIEAARAGESGRGFAVVADEVRTLAQRTQSSTIDIQDLLGRLKSEADNAVESMSRGSESAGLCLQKSAHANATFEDAAVAVNKISDINTQVAAAATEQSAVAEEVNRNLSNISMLANQTTTAVNNTSEANTNIAKNVIDLHTTLNVFVID